VGLAARHLNIVPICSGFAFFLTEFRVKILLTLTAWKGYLENLIAMNGSIGFFVEPCVNP